MLHIVGASLYLVLGALQFVPAIRRRAPGWHRRVGRVLVGAGIVAALAGLWMTQFYPLPATEGALLYGFRLVFGSAMLASIVIGFAAIRRREIGRHRAWMIRGYAIGLGAGTQAFLLIAAQLVAGNPRVDVRAVLMGAGWVLNLAVAEWLIRGRPAPIGLKPRRTHPAAAGGS